MLARLLGNKAEQAACRWLEQQGLTLLYRNWQCRLGEIDLVMDQSGSVVFIEVRQRRSHSHGGAAGSVTASKQKRLVATAQLFLAAHPELANRPCRFDVLALSGSLPQARIDWIQNAFYGEH